MDALVELRDGTRITIEIQLQNKMHWDKRQLFYWSKVPDVFGTKNTTEADAEVQVDITQIDFITQEFIQYIRNLKTNFGSKLEDIRQNYLKTVTGQIRNQDVELACNLIRDVLWADYVNDQDGEKLYFDKEHWVKLT